MRRGRSIGVLKLAAELVRLKVDIIVVSGGGNWVQAGKNATKTIPIVMVGPGADPVKAGIVESLARPGGNVTGLRPFPHNLGTAQAIDRTVTWTSPESSKNSTTSRSTTSIVEWKNTSNGCGSIESLN